MENGIDVYCLTCFALPGELCRTKFVVHGHDGITPVICPTHSNRLADGLESHMSSHKQEAMKVQSTDVS